MCIMYMIFHMNLCTWYTSFLSFFFFFLLRLGVTQKNEGFDRVLGTINSWSWLTHKSHLLYSWYVGILSSTKSLIQSKSSTVSYIFVCIYVLNTLKKNYENLKVIFIKFILFYFYLCYS